MINFLSRIIRKLRRPGMLKRNAAWLSERKSDVITSLTDQASPLYNKPYVEGGTYHWMVEEPIHLDFFFPEYQLAVKVTGREYGRYDYVEDYVPSRKFWEARTKEESFVQDVCQRGEIPLILITPDDPVDVYSLVVRLRALGIVRK